MFHGIRRQLFQKIFGGDVQLLIFATRFEKHGPRSEGKERKREKERPECLQKFSDDRDSSLKAAEREKVEKTSKILLVPILIVSLPSALKFTEEAQKLLVVL